MAEPGRRAYVYAKACGIAGKSCIGSRVSRLRSLTRLADLDRLIFPGESRELPGGELLRDLEKRITGRAVQQILTIVSSCSPPPEFLIRQLRVYEYADVKSLLNHLTAGETEAPVFTSLKPFDTVRWAAWPDLGAMFRQSEFQWLAGEDFGAMTAEENMLLQARLDRQYYQMLWESLRRLAPKDRRAGDLILREEISLRNCMWALRLRSYYGVGSPQGQHYLLKIPLGPGRSAAADAEAALKLPLDNPAVWKSWRRHAFLNPEKPGEEWKPDPRFFQNAVSRYLYRLARRYFRSDPFSLDAVMCFIKLKQFEEDILTSAAEGLGLGMSGGDILNLLGVEK
ncbi:MAG: V-type ATPase subunit [Treponema sp.]|jgi:vacuolar-type H+-ATPase subunit C/Vma6|nr:V-type ATPase subunit [Treponema sp.]